VISVLVAVFRLGSVRAIPVVKIPSLLVTHFSLPWESGSVQVLHTLVGVFFWPLGNLNLNLPVIERTRLVHFSYSPPGIFWLSVKNVSKPTRISSLVVFDNMHVFNRSEFRKNFPQGVFCGPPRYSSNVNITAVLLIHSWTVNLVTVSAPFAIGAGNAPHFLDCGRFNQCIWLAVLKFREFYCFGSGRTNYNFKLWA